MYVTFRHLTPHCFDSLDCPFLFLFWLADSQILLRIPQTLQNIPETALAPCHLSLQFSLISEAMRAQLILPNINLHLIAGIILPPTPNSPTRPSSMGV